mmetsp:Transcript_92244/g.183720  ORF Transcript_92244/g.183720 Transcript_92244/m.183720 type:complete len:246 (+) Transcript_92244:33-770(+)|eukprot:CAMPEP_0171739926 /NCGR_PEP_ID=MMETSP0991-20121206/34559_1 /TAXON_ID=483369 /ORGANISM="non described non described, Strain CCMP2098" /LENGTH=245 /DNA_ID=CAMNT_0012337707 /DNA_START=165 /DNA_END=902 /DNA_ORIENTATION=-
MFQVKEVSDRNSVARAEKLDSAKTATLPILKLIGTVSNRELHDRLDSAWQNAGVLSAFVAAIAVSFLFAELPLDEDDEDYETKLTVRSIFFCTAGVASVLLILSVSITVTNLTSLTVCPLDFVDDFLHHLGPLEGVPSVLMVVSIVALVSMIPMWVYLLFGNGSEFMITLVVASLATIFGLGWQIFMMHLQNVLLDKCLLEVEKKKISVGGKAIKADSSEAPIVEMSEVYDGPDNRRNLALSPRL